MVVATTLGLRCMAVHNVSSPLPPTGPPPARSSAPTCALQPSPPLAPQPPPQARAVTGGGAAMAPASTRPAGLSACIACSQAHHPCRRGRWRRCRARPCATPVAAAPSASPSPSAPPRSPTTQPPWSPHLPCPGHSQPCARRPPCAHSPTAAPTACAAATPPSAPILQAVRILHACLHLL